MTIFMLLCQTLSMKKVGMVVCLLLFASACGGASETLTPTSTSDLPTTTVTSTTAATPTTTVVSTTTVSPATTSMPAPSTSVVTTTTYVATTTTADTPTMSIANITNDTDFEKIDNSEVNLHLSFSCIAKELGGETWFSLWNRPVTSEESQKIQHCPTPSHNFPCVDNVLGMNKSDALIKDRYDPTEDDIELI